MIRSRSPTSVNSFARKSDMRTESIEIAGVLRARLLGYETEVRLQYLEGYGSPALKSYALSRVRIERVLHFLHKRVDCTTRQ